MTYSLLRSRKETSCDAQEIKRSLGGRSEIWWLTWAVVVFRDIFEWCFFIVNVATNLTNICDPFSNRFLSSLRQRCRVGYHTQRSLIATRTRWSWTRRRRCSIGAPAAPRFFCAHSNQCRPPSCSSSPSHCLVAEYRTCTKSSWTLVSEKKRS